MATRRYLLIGAGQEALVAFDSLRTLEENLEDRREILELVRLLPPGFEVQAVRVSYEGRILNPAIAVEEQIVGIEEEARLLVEVEQTQTVVHVYYQPDHGEERRREFQLDRREPLRPQLAAFFEELHQRHTFRGFHRRKYSLRCGKDRLHLDRSLSAQKLNASLVTVRLCPAPPGGWFGRPFRALEWSLCAVVLLMLCGIIVSLIPPRPDNILVRFGKPPKDYYLILDDQTDLIRIGTEADADTQFTLGRGPHRFRLLPKQHPIQEQEVVIDPARGQTSYDYTPRFDTSGKTFWLEVEAHRAKSREAVRTNERLGHVVEDLLINEWPVTVPGRDDAESMGAGAEKGIAKTELPRGKYTLGHKNKAPYDFAYPVDRLVRVSHEWHTRSWDFSDLDSDIERVRIVMWYIEDKEELP